MTICADAAAGAAMSAPRMLKSTPREFMCRNYAAVPVRLQWVRACIYASIAVPPGPLDVPARPRVGSR